MAARGPGGFARADSAGATGDTDLLDTVSGKIIMPGINALVLGWR